MAEGEQGEQGDQRGQGEQQEQSRARVLVDALCAAYDDEHAAQVRQVELIDELCGAFSVVDVAGPVLPGHERLVPAGSNGTPMVAEHLATELAPKLRMPIELAGMLIVDSMDLVYRHPVLWRAIKARVLRVWQGRQVASATAKAGLDCDAAHWVDGQLESALGRLPWGRLRAKLAGLIVRADAELAARKALQAQAARFVRVRQQGDGTAFIVARTDAADALRFSHLLDQLAGQLSLSGETDERDVLRAKAVGLLANPEAVVALLQGPEPAATEKRSGRRRRARASAELIIHLAPGTEVGRCEELGPVLQAQVKEWLGHNRVIVRPVVDLADDPAVDGYEVPDRIARIVRGRNPYDAFPWSSRRSAGLDQDHTVPYDHGPDRPPGQTRPNNLGPLSRRAHRAKTHSGWRVSQPEPGVFEWISPLGYRYRVDRSGSEELPPVPERTDEPVLPGGEDGRGPRPAFPIWVDLWWPRAA